MAEAMAQFYFNCDIPATLARDVRVMAGRRGPGFTVDEAVGEALALWVTRERERPRPEGADIRALDSMRLICCNLLADAFLRLAAAVTDRGALTRDPQAWREAKEARFWIMSDDRENPLSYLNCCDLLAVVAAKGRGWVRPILKRMDDGPGWSDHQEQAAELAAEIRAGGRGPLPVAATGEDDGTFMMSEQESKRYKEIVGKQYEFRETMNAIRR